MKRAIAIVLAVAGSLAAGLAVGRFTAPAGEAKKAEAPDEKKPEGEEHEHKPRVRAGVARRAAVSPRLVCFGSARGRPGSEVVVTARAAAIVSDVLCRTGDHVAAGTTILRLDARPFAAARARAEGSLAEAQAELAKSTRGSLEIELEGLKVALAQAEADSVAADRALARQEKLASGELISQRQLQEAEQGAELARRRLAAAAHQLKRAEGGIQAEELTRLEARVAQARADLDVARLQESFAELKAPIEGVVSELDVVAGQAVDVSAPLARIAAPGVVDAILQVPAERAPDIRAGASVRLLAGGVEVAHARVAGVAAGATADGFVKLRATAAEDALKVLPGTPLTGEIAMGEQECLTVPSSAVVQDDDRTVVVLLDEKAIAHKVPVKVLVRDGPLTGVEGAIAEGAGVVIEGAYNLPDGAEVSLGE